MDANKRAQRIRFKLRSNAGGRLRISVFKSLKHVHVQVIDDVNGVTVASASTNSKDFTLPKATKTQKAEWAGKEIAKKLMEKKLNAVYLDRGPYAYHGALKALAQAARSCGLNF